MRIAVLPSFYWKWKKRDLEMGHFKLNRLMIFRRRLSPDTFVEKLWYALNTAEFIRIRLPLNDLVTIKEIARSKGIEYTELIRQWISEKVERKIGDRP